MTDILEKGENTVPETNETVEKITTENTDAKSKESIYNSRQDVISRLIIVVDQPIEEAKDEVEYLKQVYYKIRKTEIEKEKAEYLDTNGDMTGYEVSQDEYEEQFKDLINKFKEKKATYQLEREKEKECNYARKKDILEELKTIVADTDNINKHYNEFVDLSKKFKEIKDIPAAYVHDLWKGFQLITENFYDLLKINKELRDYDFKKNLELKEKICSDAEALDSEPDVITAFKKLQELHEEWHNIGPVSPALREELWTRFKTASTMINKKYQGHFEGVKQKESENETKKIAICEKIENIDTSTLSNFQQWDNVTKEITALQEEWRTIGFASKKVNNALYDRYRAACDKFFKEKSDFFAKMRTDLADNLQKKTLLCEKAEALKDSTDWKNTTDQFVAIQKEWKKIGAVPRKNSEIIWKRFISACDYFFEQKEKNTSSLKSVELQNLQLKKEIISKLEALSTKDAEKEDNQSLRSLITEWNNVGHVPFKEKDKIYKQYQGLLDILFKKLNMHGAKTSVDNYASNINKLADNGKNTLYREREKLMRVFESLKNEVKNYENNIGFLSSNTKGGNQLVKEMERKIEKIKNDMQVVVQKIDLIDEKLQA